MKTLFTPMLILFMFFGHAQSNPEKHSIEIELDSCLANKNSFSTTAMKSCVNQAFKKWDEQLNENYTKLMKLISEEQQNKLKASQQKWIEYRDKEVEFSNQLYFEMNGTMWILAAAQAQLEITKSRALELESYINILSFE